MAEVPETPTHNPYAADKRVAMNHRVWEGIANLLASCSGQLQEEGWPARQTSQTTLLMALIHFHMPQTPEAAGELLQRWAVVQAAPPKPPGA